MPADLSRGLDSIASSVADGSPIDWERTDSGLADRDRRLISHLRVVDAVAHVYRSLPQFDSDAEESARATAEPAGPRWGRLILLDRIGRGASADVFRAWDVDLEREVALKLLVDDGVTGDAAANARLLREARRVARIRHPHVVHIYGAERHEGRIGLWMELVRGRTLGAIVDSDGALPPADAAAACAEVCGAVAAVHAAGLLHRDIKAQNVVRDDAGRIVLMDFGAGAEIGSRASVAGTPIYLAPEVLAGGTATITSDVYSIGVLLFFLLTGRYPVDASSLEALIDGHRARRRAPLADVAPSAPAALASIVERALDPDPTRRFGTAAELETALRAWLVPGSYVSPISAVRTWAAVAVTAAAVIALVSTVAHRGARGAGPAPLTAVAVLPLATSSNTPQSQLIADGLTDELITKLGELQSLRVTAHTSVRRFKGTERPVSEIASELRVGSVLEGSVAVDASKSDPSVHVNMRLIRAGSDVELWSDSFDRPLRDVVAIEGEIARAVVRGVGAALTTAESTRLTRDTQHVPGAEQAYLQARSYLSQNRQGEELRPALEALNEAVSLDPGFAEPHAALARTYVLLGFGGVMPQSEAYPLAKREARHALDLDPDLVDAQVALADISFYYEWDWTGAAEGYRRAIAQAPSDSRARTQYARLLSALSRTDEASTQARAAVAADPLNADVILTEGLMSFYRRHYDDAASTLQQVLRMDPRFPGAWLTLGRVEEARGNYVLAGRLMDRALTITSIPSWRADRIRVRALAGEPDAARNALNDLEAELAARGMAVDDPHRAYIYIALGEIDRGLDSLSAAVASRDPSILWLAVDPRVDRVRQDPRFREILARLGRP